MVLQTLQPPSSWDHPLGFSQGILRLLNLHPTVHFRDRIPAAAALVLVSNHRSFLDAPLLMAGVDRSVRFACHHYMGQVPGMREFVSALGCLPLDAPGQRRQSFFHKATSLLHSRETIGIFPEGAKPMVQPSHPRQIAPFQRGFAHLAMRAPVSDLAILPVAIAATVETSPPAFPLKLLHYFDPSEPLFDQPGWHPAVIYRQVNLLIGRPLRITERLRTHYQGRGAGKLAHELTCCCQEEIATLLRQGHY